MSKTDMLTKVEVAIAVVFTIVVCLSGSPALAIDGIIIASIYGFIKNRVQWARRRTK